MDKLKGMIWRGLAAMSLALVASNASAEEFRGFYAGAGIGSNAVEDDEIGFDDSDTGFKAFAGYSFGELLAIELSYIDGGTSEQTTSLDFPIFGFDTVRIETETKTINLSAVGNLPLTESFSLIGKIGYASIDTEVTFDLSGNGMFASGRVLDDTEEEISYGAGAVYNIGEQFQLRAEYEGFDVPRGKLDFISLSALFRFR